MWTDNDIRQMERKNISLDKVLSQLGMIEKGFPFLPVIDSASIGNGIACFNDDAQALFFDAWDNYLKEDHTILKFVPASGAASRMFKDLFEFLDAEYTEPHTPFVKAFFGDIEQFAFYKALNDCCVRNEHKPIAQLVREGLYKPVIENLLLPKGLDYGQLPKGLIYFHLYPEGPRTAMEEHWVEGALYASNKSNRVNIHFTVSEEHKDLFEALVKEKSEHYADSFGVCYDISFSQQKTSTDTIAAGADNGPFRDNGELVFRPGGHGALIENLNDLDADVVFIKNIDNVVPDHFKSITTRYKKLIGGVLVNYQQRIFSYLELIGSNRYSYTRGQLEEMLRFLEDELYIRKADAKNYNDQELVQYIQSKLNRPLRVCGMVRNQGEPGGGPFVVSNPDGTVSLQILESSQIDRKDPKMEALFKQGTHFNPVDLVCGLRDYKGHAFDLLRYVDPETGFISIKSKSGRELKALELPGLWNGAMSDWNTVFVEVPIETFNPVKTVNDLLRPEHQ